MTADPSARDAIAALQGHEAWAMVRSGDRDTVRAVGGSRSEVASLLDVPLEQGLPQEGHIADRLLAVPFRQVTERGFEAHDDGTPLVVVDVETEQEFPLEEIVAAIDDTRRRVRATAAGSTPTTRSTPSSSRRSSTTRSARARAPTSSSAGTTARASPTGAPTRR